MFFRPKTVPDAIENGFESGFESGFEFDVPDVTYWDNAENVQTALYEDHWVENDAEPKAWPAHYLDIASMYTFDEYECNYLFTGHFDLNPNFSFGAGRMALVDLEELKGTDAWEYEYFDCDPSALNIGLLRVTLD